MPLPILVCATEYHASVMREEKQTSFAKIVSWKRFVTETVLVHETRRILSTLEETVLFKQALKQALCDPALEMWAEHDQAILMKNLREADRLMQLYLLPPQGLGGRKSPECLLLYRLEQELRKLFQAQHTVTFLHALREALACKHPSSCDRIASQRIERFGFVDWPPLYQGVMPSNPPQPSLVREGVFAYPCKTPEEELSTAIAFFVKKIKENPSFRAGIVLSDRLLSKKTLRFWITYCLQKEGAGEISTRFSDPETLADQVHFAKWAESFKEVLPQAEVKQLLPLLNQLGGQVLMEEESQVKPSLQCVGYLEAAYLPLDAVWVMDASELNLPFRRTPNAFIPMDLQRKYGIYAGVEGEYHYSQRLLQAIFAGKEGHVSFVSPEQELPVRLSSLLKAAREEDPPFASFACGQGGQGGLDELRRSVHNAGFVSRMRGKLDLIPPAPLGLAHSRSKGGSIIKGGATLLKEQAECPFKAFAHYRLKVRDTEEEEALLGPREKGIAVHALLEAWWKECKDQRTLLNMNETVPIAWFQKNIRSLLERVYQDAPPAFRNALFELETRRLQALFKHWLVEEKKRPPFTVIGREETRLAHLSGLQFKLRLDRIDELADGSQVVIDYKTGSLNVNEWFAERITEPQLPLYALVSEIEGLLLASLKVGEMGYEGVVAKAENAFLKVKPLPSWQESKAFWKEQLEALATEFREGVADVRPIHPQVCEYCDLKTLCRIEEIKAEGEFTYGRGDDD